MLTSKGQGELTKCQRYYIILCSKLVKERGGGVKNPENSVNVVYGCPLEQWTL